MEELTKLEDQKFMDSADKFCCDHHVRRLEVEQDVPFTKQQILKNVLVVSTGFLFLFTAFQSMANLQTSLNKEDGVGAYSLAAIYIALILSCVFLPKFIIARMGCKWTIAVCMLGYCVYMGANFYSNIWLMTATGIILGIGAAPLWAAKCTYLTQLGVWYSKRSGQSQYLAINKFFGIFFMMFQTSQIWGNLISSIVLRPVNQSEPLDLNHTQDLNGIPIITCGADFFPGAEQKKNTGFGQPTEQVRNLFIIYLCCAAVAIVIVSLLLDPIRLDQESLAKDRKLSPRLLIATVKHLIRSPTQVLLVPLTLYSGLEQAFIGGDFTQSYVSCTLGVSSVGYIFICYGVVDAACSFIFGRLVQYVGHVPLLVLATLVHGVLQIVLLRWIPDPGNPVVYYVMAGLWGLADAVLQTQINALYGTLFTENAEAAFANYRLWESAGFAVTYLYQNSLITRYKLYICLVFLGIGMLGYTTAEILQRYKLSKHRTSQRSVNTI